RGRKPMLGSDGITAVDLLASHTARLRGRDGTLACGARVSVGGHHQRRVEAVWSGACPEQGLDIQLRARLSARCSRLRGRVKVGTARWQPLVARRDDSGLGRCGWTLMAMGPNDRARALLV